MGTPRHLEPVIETTALTKRYGEIAALTDLHLAVPEGSIYGFLGPNGAGKTTAIRLLMGFIRASSGSARIFGHDVWAEGVAARRDLGFLVTPDAFYPDMTGIAQLDYLAHLSGKPPVLRDRLLDTLELGRDALRRRLGSYSKGMRQKLALTAAFQHDPALLILDEPTDGLDPLIQRGFEELLRELRDRGRTIFMSSHDLAEVERTCERVAVVRAGRLVAEETVEGLKRLQRRTVEVTFGGEAPPDLALVPRVTIVSREGRRVRLAFEGDLNPLLRFLAGHDVADLVLAPPRLEDVFMAFYGDDRSGPGGAEGTPAVDPQDAVAASDLVMRR
ncbi:MAG: ABC transporter ATP-binding protein [Chloroflexota bacterium]|nr:ABC transporter ATP-binding protein [Chloroflexota bacterium]